MYGLPSEAGRQPPAGQPRAPGIQVRFPPVSVRCLGLNRGMTLDFDTCYRAVLARDPRFDGRFFTAVTSTGIYCRPVCPGPHAGPAEHAVLPARGRGRGGRVPCLPPLPPGGQPRLPGVERPGRPGRARRPADRGRVRGRARRGRAGPQARGHRAAPAPPAGGRTRRGAARAGPEHADADRAAAARGDRDADHRDRVRERVLQRPPVQRDVRGGLRQAAVRAAARAAPPGTDRRQGRAGRRLAHAQAGLPGAVRRRGAAGLPGRSGPSPGWSRSPATATRGRSAHRAGLA